MFRGLFCFGASRTVEDEPLTATTDFPEATGRALVSWARQTISEHLGLPLPQPQAVSSAALEAMPGASERHGVFVTLTIGGELRGCIGTLSAEESVVEGVTRHALNAAFHDPRFPPLSPEEFAVVAIEVSILTEPRPLRFSGPADLLDRLRPGKDGVILTGGYRSATFLPQVWSQLPEATSFLSHLCRKAGLAPDAWRTSTVAIKTYEVQHFSSHS